LRSAIQVGGAYKQCGLRGLLLACGGGTRRRNRKSDTERGNQVKPQTAAKHTYHVHCSKLKEKSTIARFSRVAPLYPARVR
jgi:hypothetical protein